MSNGSVIVGIVVALGIGAPALAQLPPGVFAGEHNYKLATPGTYKLDPGHTAVIAKVRHVGYGLSVFRFDRVEGALTWDPAAPAKSSLNVSVDTASIATPVKGFAEELAGDKYLKSKAFPKATFVSKRFQQIDASLGKVMGELTLLGNTHPATFDVQLGGAGKGFMGKPRIGVQAVTHINPTEFGLPAMFGPDIALEIDAEFEHA